MEAQVRQDSEFQPPPRLALVRGEVMVDPGLPQVPIRDLERNLAQEEPVLDRDQVRTDQVACRECPKCMVEGPEWLAV